MTRKNQPLSFLYSMLVIQQITPSLLVCTYGVTKLSTTTTPSSISSVTSTLPAPFLLLLLLRRVRQGVAEQFIILVGVSSPHRPCLINVLTIRIPTIDVNASVTRPEIIYVAKILLSANSLYTG
jgi:hypothetical protein